MDGEGLSRRNRSEKGTQQSEEKIEIRFPAASRSFPWVFQSGFRSPRCCRVRAELPSPSGFPLLVVAQRSPPPSSHQFCWCCFCSVGLALFFPPLFVFFFPLRLLLLLLIICFDLGKFPSLNENTNSAVEIHAPLPFARIGSNMPVTSPPCSSRDEGKIQERGKD